MVKQYIYVIAVFLFVISCANYAADTNHFRHLAKVVIQKNASWSDYVSSDETPEMCKDFVLTEADVKQFFTLARVASEQEYSHDLLMSRCTASGKVTMVNKKEGEWKIDRARRGLLVLTDGTRYFFYCGKCKSKVYSEACDIDCIHGE